MTLPERPFEVDQILDVLCGHGVDFVVIGGVAVQAHGYVRLTHDLDITVRPATPNFARLSEALAELGAELRGPGDLRLGDPHQLRAAPLIPVTTRFGPLDIVGVEHISGGPRSYDALRAAALEIELRGHRVAMAGLSDLIRMKRAAGRDHDLADIEALTREPEST
jgi:hypothetical protein